ncbi:MAG: hypothetical protein M1269_04815 [Chloroflexi bacterium]|nr:hypothetical protein [Chloroflexota bacterium]
MTESLLSRRIEMLEKESCSQKRELKKWRFISVAVLVVSLLAMAGIQSVQGTQEEIRAKRFTIVDDGGRTRGTFAVLSDRSAGIALMDELGKTRAIFDIEPDDTPRLIMCDAVQLTHLSLDVFPSGFTYIKIFDNLGGTKWAAPPDNYDIPVKSGIMDPRPKAR